MQFLPRLKRPGPQHTGEAAEAFALQYIALSSADGTHVVLEQSGSYIDKIGD
jgi:hypothetical protein